MTTLFKTITKLIFISILLIPMASFASNLNTQVGRYLILTDKPLPAQKNLMLQTIQVHFPPEVKTVGDAISYILKPSGYSLASVKTTSPKVKEMMMFNLPIIDRDFGPMTLQDALQTLVGNSFVTHIDRLNREVSFQLRTHDKE